MSKCDIFKFNRYIIGLINVEPSEGRLEFLAYLVNQDRQNESIQVNFHSDGLSHIRGSGWEGLVFTIH